MRHGGDYSWARPDPVALVAAGWTFAIRYISNDRRTMGTPWEKNLDALEALALSRAGLDIVLVWEGVAADRDPLRGYHQGVADARDAVDQAAKLGAPADVVVLFAVDWNAAAGELPAIGDYFAGVVSVLGPAHTGCYGHTYLLRFLFAAKLIAFGMVPMATAWSKGLDEPRAQLRQTVGAVIGGAAVDLDEALVDDFGQWRPVMTNAPDDLLAVRRAVMEQTGLTAVECGIVGDSVHAETGGYHEGKADLVRVGVFGPAGVTLSGTPQSRTDYSVRLIRDRSAATDDASALDIGLAWSDEAGGRPAAIRFTSLMVADLKAATPGTEPLRAMNYSPDGSLKRRIDKENDLAAEVSSDTVDIHTHFEFYRDTEGQRDGAFLALVKRRITQAITGVDPGAGEDDEEMSTGMVSRGFAFGGPDGRKDEYVTGIGMGPVNQPPGSGFGNKRCVLGLSTDFAPAAGVQLRLAVKANGKAWGVQTVTLKSADDRWYLYLPDGCTKVNVGRVKRDPSVDQDIITKADGSTSVTANAETCPVWWDLEFEKR